MSAARTLAEQAALSAWPGVSRLGGPSPLRPLARRFARRLNHVKLSWHPGRPLSAKAYLYVGLLGAVGKEPFCPPPAR